LAIAAGFIVGTITQPYAVLSLYLGFVIALRALLSTKEMNFEFKINELSIWSKLTFLCLSLYCFRTFLWLIFKFGDDVRVLSPNNLGDMALHINFIEHIAKSPPFWLDNTYFVGDKIRYPLGIDLFNSLFVMNGVDLFKSLKWVGLICSMLAGFMLYVWGGTFTLAGFLFNGGLAGFKFFDGLVFYDYQKDLAWKSLPLAVLVTQRAMLYSLPVGLLLLSSWRQRYALSQNLISENKNNLTLPLWLEILFFSSMPIFHFHTFIFLSLLLGWFFVISSKIRTHFIKLFMFSLPIAIFFVLLLTNNFKASSIIHFKFGWMQEKENFFFFWLNNFGIFLPLVFILVGKLFYSRKEKSFKKPIAPSEIIVIPGFILLILFFNLMLAPWEWDNVKVILWAYILLLPYIWSEVVSKLNKIQISAICFVMFFSGFICLFGGFPEPNGYRLYQYSTVSELNTVLREKNINIRDRFASFPTFNHPLLLIGRKVVIGYPGWLWTHGYKSQIKEEKLKKLMMGDENWLGYVKDLEVKYIFWGDMENREYKDSKKPWESQFTLIASGPWGKIFEARQ
jgi:hypothetical protein